MTALQIIRLVATLLNMCDKYNKYHAYPATPKPQRSAYQAVPSPPKPLWSAYHAGPAPPEPGRLARQPERPFYHGNAFIVLASLIGWFIMISLLGMAGNYFDGGHIH
jgi:hypothetical protein